AVSNRNPGILEVAIAVQVAYAKLGYLAPATGNRILMAFTAGLRVVERPEAVGDLLYLFELRQIRLMRCIVDDAIAPIVEARGRFQTRRRNWTGSRERCIGEDETQNRQRDNCVHGILSSRHRPGRE